MSEKSYLVVSMIAFAEWVENALADLYIAIRGVEGLNLVCFYLGLFLVAYCLAPKKRLAKVIYIHKKIDEKDQKSIREAVQGKIKELKTALDSLHSVKDGNKNSDFIKALDHALIEIRSIQDLHNEFKHEIIDSHSQIIDSLTPANAKNANSISQLNHHEQVKDDQGLDGNHLQSPPNNELKVPEIQSNPFAMPKKVQVLKTVPELKQLPLRAKPFAVPEAEVAKKEIPQVNSLENGESINNPIEEKPGIINPEENLIHKEEKNEISFPKTIAKLPGKAIIPKFPAIPKAVPIRGKAGRPIIEDRSKYVPPPTIKSNPFG